MEDYNTIISQEHIKVQACEECFYNSRCVGVWKEYAEMYQYLDLPPIQKQNITISVRTKYYRVFTEMFFSSFLKYYEDYIPDLHVYVDANYPEMNQEDYDKYFDLANKYGFRVHLTSRDDSHYFELSNHYTHMLWKSVDGHNGKVFSFDDDMVFHNSGLFDIIAPLLDKHKIVSSAHFGTLPCIHEAPVPNNQVNSVEWCISSWIYGINNDTLDYKMSDFINVDRHYCDGNDMVGFTMKFKDDVYYFNREVSEFFRSADTITKFYKHLSSKTYGYDRDELKINYAELDHNKRQELLGEKNGIGSK